MESLIVSGLTVMLASLRALTAFALSPAISAYGVPLSLRIFLSVVIGATALDTTGAPAVLGLSSEPTGLIFLAAGELLWGVVLGLGVHVAIAAFAVAGRLVDMQSGLSIGAAFDPVTRSHASVVSQIMSAVAVMLFFASDAHLALIELIASSYLIFPVGSLLLLDSLEAVVRACSAMFAVGFALVAPVTFALLMTELLVGVVARNMPQINVLVVAIPLKLWVAIAMLALTAHTWSQVVLKMVSETVIPGV